MQVSLELWASGFCSDTPCRGSGEDPVALAPSLDVACPPLSFLTNEQPYASISKFCLESLVFTSNWQMSQSPDPDPAILPRRQIRFNPDITPSPELFSTRFPEGRCTRNTRLTEAPPPSLSAKEEHHFIPPDRKTKLRV